MFLFLFLHHQITTAGYRELVFSPQDTISFLLPSGLHSFIVSNIDLNQLINVSIATNAYLLPCKTYVLGIENHCNLTAVTNASLTLAIWTIASNVCSTGSSFALGAMHYAYTWNLQESSNASYCIFPLTTSSTSMYNLSVAGLNTSYATQSNGTIVYHQADLPINGTGAFFTIFSNGTNSITIDPAEPLISNRLLCDSACVPFVNIADLICTGTLPTKLSLACKAPSNQGKSTLWIWIVGSVLLAALIIGGLAYYHWRCSSPSNVFTEMLTSQ